MPNPELIHRAARRVAERRIREAMERGEFDDLPGAGQPFPDANEAYDELWWVRRWLKRERLDKGEARAALLAALRELRR